MVESRGTGVRVVGRLGQGSISLGHAESIGSGGLPWACAGLGQWGARIQWRGVGSIGLVWNGYSIAMPKPKLRQD
jgi:hypothetical protein